jgi:basic membrane protein A
VRSFLRIAATQLLWLVALAVSMATLAAASGRAQREPGAGGPLRVVLFVNGTLGDKSFFDAAARGLQRAHDALGIRARVVEGGADPTRWQAALTDLADSGDWDLIVSGTYTMQPYVKILAHDYPDARFVIFDAAVEAGDCSCANVHSLLFRQNEAAYLAGWLGARLADRGLPGVPPGASLGVVGGMRFPVVEDFIVGFIAGAKDAAPGIPVADQYANSFTDPAIGSEIARLQFARGAGIVFQVAGGTGQGVMEAAAQARRYAIGVDMDQAALLRPVRPDISERILTSVVKNVDTAVFRAIEDANHGRLRYPAVESLGLAEGGVGLADGWQGAVAQVPGLAGEFEAMRVEVAAGRVRVPSAFESSRSTIR